LQLCMVDIKEKKLLLKKTEQGFENDGVFNPAAIKVGSKIYLLYRAVRTGNYSSIGYCELSSPMEVEVRNSKPLLIPENDYESQGMEDPRIVKIEDTFYLTYSAYNKVNALGALATSQDLVHFDKKGIITPEFTYRHYKHLIECCPDLSDKYFFHYKIFHEHGLGPEISSKLYIWDKNVVMFPEKINGRFAFLHRIYPGIQIVFFETLEELSVDYWEQYLMNLEDHIVMNPKLHYESSHIGAGAPPIRTKDGWLLIYHASETTPESFIYHASAALLDLDDPKKVLARLQEPLISPVEEWEQKGVVKNIIFPTGTVVEEDDLFIYYGAADERVGVVRISLSELLNELKSNGIK